MKPLSNEIF